MKEKIKSILILHFIIITTLLISCKHRNNPQIEKKITLESRIEIIKDTICSCSQNSLVLDIIEDQYPDFKIIPNKIDSSFDICNTNWESYMDWNDCLTYYKFEYENLIKVHYDSLYNSLDKEGKITLKENQTNWESSLKSELKLYNYYQNQVKAFGHETQFYMKNAYLIKLKNRVDELKAYHDLVKTTKK